MEHTQHKGHTLHLLLLGTALAAGTVMIAPYVLPLIGIGSSDMAGDIMEAAHGLSGGLAGTINNVIGSVPFIGSTLAEGGLWTAAAAGVTGIGGLILSRYVSKKEDDSTQIHWSKVIRTAALMTSALIALPAALTSLTVGITYLSAAIYGSEAAISVLNSLATTLGVGGMSGGVSGLTGILPHLITCGATILPASIAMFFGSKKQSMKMSGDMPHTDMAMDMHIHSPSFDLQKIPSDIIAKILVNHPTAANFPCEATLTLSHADGSPLTAEELAVTHTEKIHLFVTDQALRDYHHIHPMPTQTPGVYRFSFSPATSNQHSAWIDCTTLADGKEHIAKAGIASATRRNITPNIRVNNQAEQNGLQFEWKTSEPLRQGEPCIAEVTIKDSRGNPITDLEPVMGAYAHLVGFSADGNSFSHTHPLDRQPVNAEDRGGPRLRFQVEPDTAGKVQYYLHIQRGGQTIYVPFGQQVKPSPVEEEKVSQPCIAVAMAR